MVGENAGTFLFAPSKWRLNFQPETTVKMIDNFIGSLHGFHFVPFDAILNNTLADFQICDVAEYGDDYLEELDDMAGQRAIFSFKVSRWNLREKKWDITITRLSQDEATINAFMKSLEKNVVEDDPISPIVAAGSVGNSKGTHSMLLIFVRYLVCLALNASRLSSMNTREKPVNGMRN